MLLLFFSHIPRNSQRAHIYFKELYMLTYNNYKGNNRTCINIVYCKYYLTCFLVILLFKNIFNLHRVCLIIIWSEVIKFR